MLSEKNPRVPISHWHVLSSLESSATQSSMSHLGVFHGSLESRLPVSVGQQDAVATDANSDDHRCSRVMGRADAQSSQQFNKRSTLALSHRTLAMHHPDSFRSPLYTMLSAVLPTTASISVHRCTSECISWHDTPAAAPVRTPAAPTGPGRQVPVGMRPALLAGADAFVAPAREHDCIVLVCMCVNVSKQDGGGLLGHRKRLWVCVCPVDG